ncbi:MAG: hypothetical protein R3182_13625 [Draconibacterium sp.]|nr:hypothetical protein [Draconibacterium sp.]
MFDFVLKLLTLGTFFYWRLAMQETQFGYDLETGMVDIEPMDNIDVASARDTAKSKFSIESRRKIENLLEEKALRKLLEDDYNFDG